MNSRDSHSTAHRPPQRVAIVHDWLVGGGAERVVLELHRMFPDAPIYTSYCTDEWRAKLDGKVITGILQHWPFSVLRKYLPVLRIWWFTNLDFSGYDLVISSSGNGEAKGIHVPKGTTHVCYCHSPTHFYWRHYDQYLSQPGFGIFNPLVRLALRMLVNPLRKWDLKASARPDYYIANSTHIQSDIKKYYGRESIVIHPPIDVERFQGKSHKEPAARSGYITVGRQVPYKKTDLIVRACTELNLPLTVIGKGPDNDRLRKMAGSSITFMNATDKEVATALSTAEAFIFAAFEDFGITPIEAMAAGTPIIAFKGGGALDYVQPGVTGEFFAQQSVESLVKVLQKFNSKRYNATVVAQSADAFSSQAFAKRLKSFLQTI